MAYPNTVGSIFNIPSVAEIVNRRKLEEEAARAQRNQQYAIEGKAFGPFSALYSAARGFGDIGTKAAMQTMMGDQPDFELKQWSDISGILANVDQTDPGQLREAASQIAKLGYVGPAFNLATQARQIEQDAAGMSLKERQVAAEESRAATAQMQAETAAAKEAKGEVTSLVTENNEAVIQKEGKLFVQKVSDNGEVSLEPYNKKRHGGFATKIQIAAAGANPMNVVKANILRGTDTTTAQRAGPVAPGNVDLTKFMR